MAPKVPDVSFTACNFYSFSLIHEAGNNSQSLQRFWCSLPDAVKNGDLEEQLRWDGDKKKLMSILYKARIARAGIYLSYALVAAGVSGVTVSLFYTSAIFPIIGLICIASGIVLNVLARFFNVIRPRFSYCMHTHGVFIWGEVSNKNKLKNMVDRLA